MKRIQQIVLLVLPMMLSILLIRWIIISGAELREGIHSYLLSNYSIYMGDWELDHAAFGFSLGAPLLIWTVVLKFTNKLSLARLTLCTLAFYLLQIIGITILCALFVDVVRADSILIPFSYVNTPSFWFTNFALIVASIFSYLTLSIFLIVKWFNNSKNEPSILDS